METYQCRVSNQHKETDKPTNSEMLRESTDTRQVHNVTPATQALNDGPGHN